MDKQRLNEQMAIPGTVVFAEGQGGLVRGELTAGGAVGHVDLHGAHLTHWAPVAGKPVLWISERSRFEQGVPIRGGVPVCWPWFGPHPSRPELGNHGFVRTMPWAVEGVTQPDAEHVSVTLRVKDTEQTRAIWPYAFELRLTITVGAELAMALEVRNTGDAPFTFSEAFHPYFAVGDIREAAVGGLSGLEYVDLRDGSRHHDDAPRLLFTGETDREYVDTRTETCLEGGLHFRRIRIAKTGSDSTVVWNPWAGKAREMSDFGDDEWVGMVCVEPANAATCNAVTLRPGERHVMTATISVAR